MSNKFKSVVLFLKILVPLVLSRGYKYYQVWKDIFGVINRGQGELKLHEKVVVHDGDFPIKQVFKIHSITIVIKSLI